jgi:hypothetical protein
MAETDLNLEIEIARARAAAARARRMKTTREVPEYVAEVDRFTAQKRLEEQQAAQQQSAQRPFTALDYAFNALPIPALDPRTKSAMGEGVTLGVPSAGMAAVDTLAGFLTGGGPSFGEALGQRQDEARMRRAYDPMAATAGELVSGAAVGGALGRGAQRALGAALPTFAGRPVGQALTQGAAGAAEGAGYSAITGEGDPLTNALFGAALGGATGLVMPMTGEIAADDARRQAAERLFGAQMTANLGRPAERPLDIIDLISRRRELGPEATIADLDPLLAQTARGAVTPRTGEAAAPLIAAASSRTRPVADILIDDIDAAIAPSYGKVARAEDRATIIAGARTKYDEALTEMRAEGFEVDHTALRDTIESAFAKEGVTTSSFAAARNRMLAELDGLSGYRPPRYNEKGELVDEGDPGRPLTVDEALALKKEFDFLVAERDPTKAVPREVRAAVIDTKNALNDELKSNDKFAAAAKIYADEFDVQNAEKFASEVFKGNYSADDFAKMYGKMSDLEKQAVARAARDEIQIRFFDKPGGAERFARRIGPTQDAAFTKKLDTIFGVKAGDKLYDAAMRARAFGETARAVDEAAGQSAFDIGRGVGVTRDLANIADVATIGQQSAQGRFTSGPVAGAMRRLFVESKKAGNEAVQRQMLGYLGQQGTAADEAIMEIMSYLYGTAPPRMVSGMGGAVGGAAGIGIGGYTGPEE